MMEDIIIGEIISLIKKGLKKLSKEQNQSEYDCQIVINPTDDTGDHKYQLFVKFGYCQDFELKQMITTFDIIKYKGLGFDVIKKTPEYISGFIMRVAEENKVSPTDFKLMLLINKNNELKAYKLSSENYKVEKEVTLDYILSKK